jgi:hypothetical protein
MTSIPRELTVKEGFHFERRARVSMSRGFGLLYQEARVVAELDDQVTVSTGQRRSRNTSGDDLFVVEETSRHQVVDRGVGV